MRPSRSRYVTACQQLLALGVVVVALAPATNVVSLDVVGVQPGTTPTAQVSRPVKAALSAYSREAVRTSRVPVGVVEPIVREVPLTASSARSGSSRNAVTTQARVQTRSDGRTRITSRPQAVTGYGTVGVTWRHGVRVGEGDIDLVVRTEDDGAWSGWQAMDYHDDHGPDADSDEARHARPGTDEALVGTVDRVQVRVTLDGVAAPADMKLAVVEPGEPTVMRSEVPAIDTAQYDDEVAPSLRGSSTSARKTAVTPRPQIYSRAQWGADEKMREQASLHYAEVHGGFVHHTVNSNTYKRRDVPAILRSIYAYHTKSRGWSDIGYNFLVDRFGRIWEGRYGGVDRPVVGAHTLGYNDYAFAMSAIGNFDLVKPTTAMLQAYGALFAWKLSLHGVSAGSGAQQIGSTVFPAISGHRDAASTACPGKYLYKKLPRIRKLAAAAQQSWAGRDLQSDLAGSPKPDLIVRRASDGQGVILPLAAGGARTSRKIVTNMNLGDADLLLKVGDWDRDGAGDVVTRSASTGNLELRRGNGKGAFAAPAVLGAGYNTVNLLAAVGDVTGDGYPDLMGQPSNGAMMVIPGAGAAGLGVPYDVSGAIGATAQYGAGLWDGDGAPDTLVRTGDSLRLYAGNGPGRLVARGALPISLIGFASVIPLSDVTGAGHPDLVLRQSGTGDLYIVEGSAAGFGTARLLKKGAKYDMAG